MRNNVGGGIVHASYLFGSHHHNNALAPWSVDDVDEPRTRRALFDAFVPMIVLWLAIALMNVIHSRVVHDGVPSSLPGRYSLTVSGMTLTLLSLRHAFDSLARSPPARSANHAQSTPATIAAASLWRRACRTLAQKGRSVHGDKTNLVLTLGVTSAYVLTCLSMCLEAGHTEWALAGSSSSSSSTIAVAAAVGDAIGDTTGSEEETQEGGISGAAAVALFDAGCSSLVVLMVHAAVAIVLTRRRLILSRSLRRYHFSISTSMVVAAMDKGALVAWVLSLVSIALSVLCELPRADVMLGAVAIVVCCSRAIRFVKPILWMLAGGDATILSPEVAMLLALLERELMLLHGVLGIHRWHVDVLSCCDNGGCAAMPSVMVLCARVRCQRSMTAKDISATTQEVIARCHSLADSSCGMTLHKCFVELSPESSSSSAQFHLRPPVHDEMPSAATLAHHADGHECHGHHKPSHMSHHCQSAQQQRTELHHTGDTLAVAAPTVVIALPPVHAHHGQLVFPPPPATPHSHQMHDV
jgi:hypothetical protein